LLPDQQLSPNTTYYLRFKSTSQLVDFAGNILEYPGSYRLDTAATTDNSAPAVTAVNFADGTDQMPVNGRIELGFSEGISAACLEQGVDLVGDSGSVSVNYYLAYYQDILQVAPTAPLNPSTQYSLQLNALCDLAGNALPSQTLQFSTLASVNADTTAPLLQSSSPAEDAVDVSVNSNITLQYDEVLDLRTSTITLRVTNGSYVTGAVQVTDDTMVFTPDAPLQSNTSYLVFGAFVRDLAGNSRPTTKFTFTTE
jgi:large repetitive protein